MAGGSGRNAGVRDAEEVTCDFQIPIRQRACCGVLSGIVGCSADELQQPHAEEQTGNRFSTTTGADYARAIADAAQLLPPGAAGHSIWTEEAGAMIDMWLKIPPWDNKA